MFTSMTSSTFREDSNELGKGDEFTWHQFHMEDFGKHTLRDTDWWLYTTAPVVRCHSHGYSSTVN